MNPNFPYRHLPEGGDEIRLLTLFPVRLAFKLEGQDDAAAEPLIECQLDHYSLSDYSPPYASWLDRFDSDPKLRQKEWNASLKGWVDRNAANETERETWVKTARNRFNWGDYWALSYAWGDPSKKQLILLNGTPFLVTENLYQALRRLAEEVHHIVDGVKLWVDAICINQSDLAERERQVARMGDIYSNARGVEAWLGLPLSGDQSRAIQAWQKLNCTNGDKGPEGLLKTDVGAAGDMIHSIVRLALEPYWERVWVIQELALASSESLFLYGDVRLSLYEMYSMIRFAALYGNWDGFYASGETMTISYSVSALRSLRRVSDLVTRAIIPLVSMRDSCSKENTDPLVDRWEMLSLVPGGKATDLRDKAYGIRALLPSGISDRIPPDYSVTKKVVWSRFTKAIIEESDNLNILASTKLPTSGDLPSWALNLDLPRDGRFIECHASGYIEPRFRFSEDCAVLHCQGVRVDKITAVGAKAKLDGEFSTGAAIKINFQEILVQSLESENRESVNIDDVLRLGALQVLMGDPSLTYDDLDGPTVFDFPIIDLMSVMEKLVSNPIMGEERGQYKGNYLRRKILEELEMEEDAKSIGSASVDEYSAYLHDDLESEDEDISPEDSAREWLTFTVEYWRHLAPFFMWRRANAGFMIGEHELADFFHWNLKRPPLDKESFAGLVERAGIVCGARTMIMTEGGRMGLASAPAQPGDDVYVVIGCDWPLLMRGKGDGLEIGGNCFVDGLMLGDAVLELPPEDWNNIEWLTIR